MKKVFLFFIVIFWSFTFPQKIEKLIDKELKSVFDRESLSKELISFDEEVHADLLLPFKDDNFFKITDGSDHVGYFYYGKALSKADTFDFLVIFDNNLIIKKIKIVAYREDYGGEISSKRWLKQFNDLTENDQVAFKKDIKAISGATISARSLTDAINKLLQSLSILKNKNHI